MHRLQLLVLSILVFGSSVFAQPNLSGDLSGTLHDTTYLVIGNIEVTQWDSLYIEAGAELIFIGQYRFHIYGWLQAIGTETDSIYFQPQNPDSTWGGITFFGEADSDSRLEYCHITGSDYDPPFSTYYHGTGVSCHYSSPTIANCTVTGNHSGGGYNKAGGIYCYFSLPVIDNCVISQNTSSDGGGIYCEEAYPYIMNCVIEDNHSSSMGGGGIYCRNSAPNIDNCLIDGNSSNHGAGGIALDSSDAFITNCTVSNNEAGFGIGAGGIRIYNSSPLIENCLITENIGGGQYGGITVQYASEPVIRYCTISYNQGGMGGGIHISSNLPVQLTITGCEIVGNSAEEGGGIYCGDNTITEIDNCTFYGNIAYWGAGVHLRNCSGSLKNSIIAGSTGPFSLDGSGLYLGYENDFAVENCCFFDNSGGDIEAEFLTDIGVLATFNSNADSCDLYGNIFLDPMLDDPANGNFNLTGNSPCIDAGHHSSELDADITIADIGANYFHQNVIGVWLDGNCLTLNPDNHIGTKVTFSSVPLGFTDSTYTTMTGHYQKYLSAGTYDILFENFWYQPYLISAHVLDDSTTLADIQLVPEEEYIHIAGNLSGTLETGVYIADDDLIVAENESLVIELGTVIHFTNGSCLSVEGILQAVGTETDSIIFTGLPPFVHWEGIDISGESASESRFEYCLVENSISSGISIFNSDITITDSRVSSNDSPSGGGGIWCEEGSLEIGNSEISFNTSQGYTSYNGGGIGFKNSTGEITNCAIHNNSRYLEYASLQGAGIGSINSDLILTGCDIHDNESTRGGGICLQDTSSAEIIECHLHNNSISNSGSGIYISDSEVLIENCTVNDNSAWYGAGIYSTSSMVEIMNCTIASNIANNLTYPLPGGGVFVGSGLIGLYNSIIYNNTAPDGAGIHLSSNAIAAIEYNTFFGNDSNDFGGDIPPELGLLSTINFNGDSCDVYYNIYLDPMFVDPNYPDFNLTWGSPCIDAGDPDSPLDPDSTIADIGAYYFDQLTGVEQHTPDRFPVSCSLSPAYPNPFNSSITLPFTLDRTLPVRIVVYNQLGQEVVILMDERMNPGIHQADWDAGTVSSGVYLVRLEMTGSIKSQKVILVK